MNCVNKFEYAKNGGVVSTMVLVYQALHDCFHFGEKKLNKLQQCTQKRAEAFDNLSEDGKEKLFNSLRNELLDNVLKMQLVDDFIIHMIKMLRPNGKARETAQAAISLMYVLMTISLWKDFKFTKEDIELIQKKIKDYVFVIRDNEDINIYSFMKCLKLECRQQFKSLESYEAEYGRINIGPKRAIYKLVVKI